MVSAVRRRATVGQLPFLWDCIANLRYIFLPTPDEYIEEALKQLQGRARVHIPVQTGTGVINEPYVLSAPPEPG